jgi:hypothetical protein
MYNLGRVDIIISYQPTKEFEMTKIYSNDITLEVTTKQAKAIDTWQELCQMVGKDKAKVFIYKETCEAIAPLPASVLDTHWMN